VSSGLLIAAESSQASLLRAGLAAAVDEVVDVSEPEAIAAGSAPAVAVMAVGDDPRGWIRVAAARLAARTRLIVVLPAGQVTSVVDTLQAEPRVAAVITAERATSSVLASLTRRVVSGGFGLARWLPAGTEIRRRTVGSYAEKLACIDELQRYAESALIRGKYREAIAEVADEVLMNALYAAPRAAASAGATRRQSIAERAGRRVEVEWARAGEVFYVAVRDRWGALQRESLLDRWSAALAAGAGEGGAGLGMSIIADASTSIHLVCAPGVATECICAFDTRQTRLHLQEIDLLREADPARIAELPAAPAVPVAAAAGPVSTVALLLWALVAVVVILALALALR